MSTSGGSVIPEPSVEPTSPAYLEELLTCRVTAVHQVAAFVLDPDKELCIKAKAHRNDLVTQVDRGVEEHIAGHLEATDVLIYDEEAHHVENFETYRGRAQVLDPIDGTLNYMATHRDWAISLVLADGGMPTLAVLADPAAGRLYTTIRGWGAWVQLLPAGSVGIDDAAPRTLERLEDLSSSEGMLIVYYQLTQDAGISQAIEASRGMRCYGVIALEMAEATASGVVVYAQSRLQSWDIAAGALLYAETGAALTWVSGAPFDVRRADSLLVGTSTTYAEVSGHLHVIGT